MASPPNPPHAPQPVPSPQATSNPSRKRRKTRSRRPRFRQERSAGVVVYRVVRSPVGTPRRLFLLLDYGRHWDYPKGHLEKGEDDRTAALRELEEETGITDIELADGFGYEITYDFHSSRKGPVRKVVHFFVGKVTSDQVRLSHEHVGAEWLELEAALARVTFENARNILAAAAAHVHRADPLDQPSPPDDSE